MLKKIIGVILAVIGIVLGYSMFTSTEDETRAAWLKEAVYLSKPEVLPANEGKVVVISGRPVLLEKAADPDLGIRFTSPFVRRYVEIYKDTANSSSGKHEMHWTSIGSIATGKQAPFTEKKFYGSMKIGDFLVKDEFLEKFNLIEVTGLTTQMGNKFRLQAQSSFGRSYLTQSLVTNSDNNYAYNNRKRIRYAFVDMSEMEDQTLVGIQKGNEIMYKGDHFTGEIYAGSLTKEQIQRKRESNAKVGSIFGYLCCAGLIAAGVYLIQKKNEYE